MDDRRRLAGLVLVAICVVLLPVGGALGTAWLAAPLIALGVVGLGLLVWVMASPRR